MINRVLADKVVTKTVKADKYICSDCGAEFWSNAEAERHEAEHIDIPRAGQYNEYPYLKDIRTARIFENTTTYASRVIFTEPDWYVSIDEQDDNGEVIQAYYRQPVALQRKMEQLRDLVQEIRQIRRLPPPVDKS